MGQVQQPGSVMPNLPNSQFHNGSPGSCGPTGRSASTVKGSNDRFMNGDPNNGFIPLTKSASPVHGSNEQFKFNVSNAQMPQPPSALQPGQGAVPVRPFSSGNGVTGPVIGVVDTPVKMPKGQ
jgi:hypothetical protein